MKNVIFYFSGTGNSFYTASKIAEALTDTVVVKIRQNNEFTLPDNLERVGFVLPVYHWTIPDFSKSYIENLTLKAGTYYFGIITCGGIPVNAPNDLEKLLNKQGVSLTYTKVHNNVASYVAMYEPFPDIEKTLPQSKAVLKSIIKDVQDYVNNQPVRKSLIKEGLRFIQIPFTHALPNKDKGFSVENSCTACGLCEKLCPVSNIQIKNGRPCFKHQCAQCMSCIVYCPCNAINYKNKTKYRTKYHHPDTIASHLILPSMWYE